MEILFILFLTMTCKFTPVPGNDSEIYNCYILKRNTVIFYIFGKGIITSYNLRNALLYFRLIIVIF
jgi:hypothetical protein